MFQKEAYTGTLEENYELVLAQLKALIARRIGFNCKPL